MKRIELFKCSYAVLQQFLGKWLDCIDKRCKGDDQRQAAFYVWARYSMSMNTLDALLNPHLIPDLSVICRSCLELDITLEAVIKDKEMAQDYLDFDKHAKARYLNILSGQGDFNPIQLVGN